MEELYCKVAFVVLWIVYIALRVPFAKDYKLKEKIKKVNAAGEKMLLALLSVGLMIVPLIWVFTDWLGRLSLSFPLWVRITGIVIAAISLFYFRQIHKALGQNWSPTLEIMKAHTLIKSGPYKLIRHPMYAQIWLWTIAQALLISNTAAGFSGILAWAILYLVRVPNEERMMQDTFGEDYTTYVKQTGSVIPRISR